LHNRLGDCTGPLTVNSNSDSRSAATSPVDVVLLGGFGQLRPLAAAGLSPYVVLRTPRDSLRHSRYFRDSGLLLADAEANERGFVTSLIHFAERLPAPPVLYYGDDFELGLIARHRQRLRETFRFAMPDAAMVEACLDKALFFELGERRGLPLPRQRVATPDLDARAVERSVGFPCVLKPNLREGWLESAAIRSVGGKPQKILRAGNRVECEAALAAMRRYTDNFVVQTFIPGGEEQVYSFHAYIPESALPRAAYVGRKIRTYPSMGGQSTLICLVHDDEIMRLGWEMVDRLGITGIVKIDFKRDAETGRAYVLEVNLRWSLWTQLGARCGINLADLAYRDQCGDAYDPPSRYRTDVCWLNLAQDVKTFFGDYRPRGELSTPAWIRSYLRPKVYQRFAWDDPMPTLLHLVDVMKSASSGLSGRLRRSKTSR
jgi:predicted ATP-grasp superfamily ATP-dependent carboligase